MLGNDASVNDAECPAWYWKEEDGPEEKASECATLKSRIARFSRTDYSLSKFFFQCKYIYGVIKTLLRTHKDVTTHQQVREGTEYCKAAILVGASTSETEVCRRLAAQWFGGS
jgi:hypothetical protein